MVVPAGNIGTERVFGRVTTRAVPAVVAERDRLGENDVEPDCAGNGGGDLGDLEGVGEPGALMILGEDEHLGLAGEPPERRGAVEDPIAVAFEAGAERIGCLGAGPRAGADGQGGPLGERRPLELLAGLAVGDRARPDGVEPLAMGVAQRHRRLAAGRLAMAGHRRRPLLGAA